MIRQWLRTHRQSMAAAVSGTAIVAVISTVAIVSGGYTAQRIDLGDSAVWVSSDSKQVVGRANTQVYELNSVIDAASDSIDIAQDGARVLVTDRSESSIDIVDPAKSVVAASVPLPPDNARVDLAGGTVVISADGGVWIVPAAGLEDFSSASDPTLSLGAGSITSVAPDGRMFAYTPSTGDLVEVDTAAGAVVSTRQLDGIGETDVLSLSSVGGRWVLLDATTRILYTASGPVDLTGLIADGTGAVLQQPALEGDSVLVAHRAGIIEVPFGGGQPSTPVEGRAGAPAAPIAAGGCLFAAWADATVWRRCGSGEGRLAPLEGLGGSVRLVFRSNGASVVLNDAQAGSTWAVQADNQLIDNWDELIDQRHDETVVQENDDDKPPEYQKNQVAPTAVDDAFGARPGRASTLPVLLNDFDPNGDVLVISAVTPIPAELGRIDLMSNNQQILLTLPADASGVANFDYTITDGRGGSATATVSVTVRSAAENGPPKQVRTTRTSVQEGGRVSTQVLADWLDPDGDAMFLSGASAPAPDLVASKPDGTVIFSDATGGDDQVHVGLVVSDGRQEASGTLLVGVKPAGTVPIIIDPFVVQAYAGEEVTIAPLSHARGGGGALTLVSVPAKPDVKITPDYDGGTFRFSTDAIRTHYVEFAISDGVRTETGNVRIDVSPVPNDSTVPITVPHTAFVRSQSSATLDVLASDIDPMGGVLLVTGVGALQEGLRVEILEQRLLRITLTRPLENGSTSFEYRVSNGLADAVGTVTVIEVPPPQRRQAPIANADTASVRVGDVIDIPVLDNDEQPDGDPLTLDPVLADRPDGSGLMFASGRVLRYLAPDKPGNYTAIYTVSAPDGQSASAEVRISVREEDKTSNNPPTPRAVTARVLAGDTVRVRIPLTGIDPDGDSVKLIGQETNPEKGAVAEVGADWFDYVAGDYSAGTDTFQYTVIDALGARASATVRIGISPRLEGGRNPIAVEDEVFARPGASVLVQPLTNDSDPDGGILTITGVQSTAGSVPASVDGDVVRIEVPDIEGDYGFIYTIQNARGGTSSNFITVRAQTDAPLSRPDARDTVLSLSEIIDRQTVDVDVLANVFFADGSPRDLKLSVYPGYDDVASVTANHRIRVRVQDAAQIIPFQVAHPDDPSIVAFAFVWVPGYADALPQLRRSAPPITVVSGASVSIAINDYVVAVGGKKVRITDSGTVRATHGDGSDLVVNAQTLRFRSADKYFGPASIAFEVTDGTSVDDPAGRVATIVLPITVTPRQNQPPAFLGAVIEVEPDQSKTIDLTKLTNYPYPADMDELNYTILDPSPNGLNASINGQKLTMAASASAVKGSQTTITVGVRDALKDGSAGRIVVRFVASTRPLAVPAADSAVTRRGTTTTVDVLANDSATNPFPGTPLRVVAVRGLDAPGLPAGVRIEPSADKSRLQVTVAADAPPVDTNLQYQVADATGDPDRYTWGSIRISVQDRPDPVTGLHVTGYGDRSITVVFDAAAFNNSPVTGYDLTLLDASGAATGAAASCASTTCVLTTPGNGQSNAVRVQVVAKNAIGASDPSVIASPVWSDIVPPPPTGLSAAPLDGGLRLGWDAVAVAAGGSAVRTYVITVGGVQLGEFSATDICAASRCSVSAGGLTNGSDVPFSVSARNEAYPALTSWNSASGTGRPYGPPTAGSITAVGNADNGTVTLNWSAFDAGGDPQGIAGYFAQRLDSAVLPSGSDACTVSSPAPGTVTAPSGGTVVRVDGSTTSATFTGLTSESTQYNFVVWGFNRSGCRATAVTGVIVRTPPGPVTGITMAMEDIGNTRDARITGLGGGFAGYQIRSGPGGAVSTVSVGDLPRAILGADFGSIVSFQVRGESTWGTWGPWTDAATPQAPITLEMNQGTNLLYDPALGQWSWTSQPANVPVAASNIRCWVDGAPSVAADSATTCSIPEAAPGATPGVTPGTPVWLEIEINGQTRRYTQ
jgi:hypothetical protein